VLVFSAKEAVFKCLYPIVGRYFGYEDVRVVSLVVDSGTFGVRLDTPLSSEFPAGTVLEGRYRQDRDFVHTAVCLEGLRKA
jgi:enterobactin synthetase component D